MSTEMQLLALLFTFILGGLIVPFVNWVKVQQWFKAITFITPDFLSAVLSLGVIIGLAKGLGLAPDATWAELIAFALGSDKVANFTANRIANRPKPI